MEKYFLNLKQTDLSKIDFFLNRLSSENLCPFAAQVLFPYVFSFQRGSWFRWEKSKNSVTAQCPNPDSSLCFRIIKQPSGKISAEVIAQRNECLAGHKIGDFFSLSADEKKISKYSYCQSNKIKSLSISVIAHSPHCRYYKKPGQIIAFDKLVPTGFCLPAYYYLYPYALSLLYDGVDFNRIGKERTACLNCFNNKNNATIKVGTARNIFSPFLSYLDKLLRFLGRPRDVLDKSVKIAVVERKENCLNNIGLGQMIKFNLYNKKELCPAVFYNLFPFLVMMSNGILPYWAKNGKQLDVHCPDFGADIIHRIYV